MCCQHFLVSFYHGEIAGNGTGLAPAELTTQITLHLAFMKGTEKGWAACVALRYTLQESYRCSIYEKRSSARRKFHVFNEDGKKKVPRATRNSKAKKATRIACYLASKALRRYSETLSWRSIHCL